MRLLPIDERVAAADESARDAITADEYRELLAAALVTAYMPSSTRAAGRDA